MPISSRRIDGLAASVRQLDADCVAAGNDGDAGGDRAHRAGDIVGKADDAGRLDAGGRFQLVERDDRAGSDMDDLALDAEVLEHAFEHAGILLQRIGRKRSSRGRHSSARRGDAAEGSWKPSGRMKEPCDSRSMRFPGCGRDDLRHDARLWLAARHLCRRTYHPVVAIVIRQDIGRAGRHVGIERRIVIVVVIIERDRRRGNNSSLCGTGLHGRLDALATACRGLGPDGFVERAEFIIVEVVGRFKIALTALARPHAEDAAHARLAHVPGMRQRPERQPAALFVVIAVIGIADRACLGRVSTRSSASSSSASVRPIIPAAKSIIQAAGSANTQPTTVANVPLG